MSEEVEEAIRVAVDALQYAGVGDQSPRDRLLKLIRKHMAMVKGDDDWRYWNMVCEKLQDAEAALVTILESS